MIVKKENYFQFLKCFFFDKADLFSTFNYRQVDVEWVYQFLFMLAEKYLEVDLRNIFQLTWNRTYKLMNRAEVKTSYNNAILNLK